MKIMVISDTHNDTFYLKEALSVFRKQNYDKLYLLGDLGTKSIELLNPLHEKIVAVKGNNDFYSETDAARFDMPLINYDYALGKLIVLTHGHYYNHLNYDGDYGIFLSGHTHQSMIYHDPMGSYIANPGSLGLPRDGCHSYMSIDEKGMKVIDVTTGAVIHFQDF